jgi:hypothetical protein
MSELENGLIDRMILVNKIESLHEKLKTAIEVIEFYANKKNMYLDVDDYKGSVILSEGDNFDDLGLRAKQWLKQNKSE